MTKRKGKKLIYVGTPREIRPYVDTGKYIEHLKKMGNPQLVKALLEGDWALASHDSNVDHSLNRRR